MVLGLRLARWRRRWPAAWLTPAALGFFLPVLWLSSQVSRRKNSIIKSLPDALDLLTVCVEAGLGFDGAMQHFEDLLGEAMAAIPSCPGQEQLGQQITGVSRSLVTGLSARETVAA